MINLIKQFIFIHIPKTGGSTIKSHLRSIRGNTNVIMHPHILDYINRYFYVKVNEKSIPLEIKNKRLSGEDENTALWIYLEHSQLGELSSIEIKNAIFTDLFFDQNNIVYIHHNNQSNSVMLNKKTSVYQLKF